MRAEVERIADQLTRAHSGGAWHGPSLEKLLEGVDAGAAEARPIASAHSIRELVAHVVAWQEEAVRRLEWQHRTLPPAEDWPETRDWSALLERLGASHAALVEAVLRLDDTALSKKVRGDRETFYVLLHGIVQHNLYHAGQVALVKKALDGR